MKLNNEVIERNNNLPIMEKYKILYDKSRESHIEIFGTEYYEYNGELAVSGKVYLGKFNNTKIEIFTKHNCYVIKLYNNNKLADFGILYINDKYYIVRVTNRTLNQIILNMGTSDIEPVLIENIFNFLLESLISLEDSTILD